MKNNIISFVIGLTAGFLGGLVGLGGGLIMIPLMVVSSGLASTRRMAPALLPLSLPD